MDQCKRPAREAAVVGRWRKSAGRSHLSGRSARKGGARPAGSYICVGSGRGGTRSGRARFKMALRRVPEARRRLVLTAVCRTSAPDFTTEATEITETDRKERKVRSRLRSPLPPASVASVASVVKSGSRVWPANSAQSVVSTYDPCPPPALPRPRPLRGARRSSWRLGSSRAEGARP